MARLVEILALEMEKWPEGVTHLTQSSVDREIYDARDGKEEDSVDSLNPRFDTRKSHTEGAYPIVTRAQWQAERDRQKGGEWKRHRGGKQPVADDVVVEYKLRGGYTDTWSARSLSWSHEGGEGDVMQYRIISQPQAEENTFAEAVHKPIIEALNTMASEWHTDQIDGPIKWRDTIIHCQAIIEDCELEIQRNVDLLDAEGLMMQTDSKKAMQHYDALQVEPKDWQIGDILEITKRSDANSHDFRLGEHVKVDFFDLDDEDLPVRCYALDDSDYWYIKYDDAKFVRRP
jgi:hypothetical protein